MQMLHIGRWNELVSLVEALDSLRKVHFVQADLLTFNHYLVQREIAFDLLIVTLAWDDLRNFAC